MSSSTMSRTEEIARRTSGGYTMLAVGLLMIAAGALLLFRLS